MLTLANTQSAESELFGTASAKETAVARWVGRRLGSVTHERQVAAVASSLFDLTKPLHAMGVADRRLLRLGALVHDVGRAVNKAEHPAVGAEMLLSAGDALLLTRTERRLLAYLTAYHKGDVPRPGDDAILCPTDGTARMLRL